MAAFGSESTTDEVLEGVDLTGRRILVTGASAGLGVETTRALAAHGASVTMAVRDLAKGAAAMDGVLAAVPGADIDLRRLDLADLASVRTFADGFLEDHPTLDVLIANAGIMACPYGTTVDGFELQFGTNHLGHFLLITRLLPALARGRRSPRRGALSSAATASAMSTSTTLASSASPTTRGWRTAGPRRPTCCARSASTSATGRRASGRSPSTPGASRPSSAGTSPRTRCRCSRTGWRPPPPRRCGSPCRRAPPPRVYAATSPDLDGQGGVYLEDCHVSDVTDDPTPASACGPTRSTPTGPTRCGRCPSGWSD